ncbi:hypothetical protein ACG02S_07785 [Roseateles sp. DC23W]|uniref:Prophage tail length tape measure protein n=1 Tax=Pelomonas dachongensis TaxID=3299029 RepID=A0ABW7ELP1_9BURK
MSDQKARIEILADARQAVRELGSFASSVSATSSRVLGQLSGIGGGVLALHGRFAALGALVGGGLLTAGVKAQIDLADAANDSAEAAGVGVQTFTELSWAFQMGGGNADSLGKTLTKVNDAMAKAAAGDPDMKRLFGQTLNVSVRDATGAIRGVDEVLEDIAERFAALPDGPEKAALAVKIFGERIGPGLLPLLNMGKAGIHEAREEFRRLHGTISDDFAQGAGQFNDNMDRINVAMQGVRATMANAVMPTLVEFSNFFVKAAKDVGTFEAAWLTFGKVAARVLGTDEIGQYRGQLRDLEGEMERIKLVMIGVENTLAREPGHAGAARRMATLTAQLAKAGAQAEETRRKIAGLEEDAKGPPPAPKPKSADGSGSPLGDLSKPAAVNRTAEWASVLEQQKKAYADGMALQGQFTEWGHAEESRYWQGILSRADLSQAEKLGATERHLTAERNQRKQAAATDLATQQVAIDAARNNFAQQAELMQAYVARVAGMYGEDSREYQQALRSQLQMRRDHEGRLRDIANQRREAETQDQLDEVADIERMAELARSLGQLTQLQLLQIRAQSIEQRRLIELQAKQAELEAEKGGPNDPVAVERTQAEIAAIKRRYKGLADDNQGQQSVQRADPMSNVANTSQQQLQQGFTQLLTRFRVTAQGVRDIARQIGTSMVTEMVSKPLAEWLVGQARMVAMTWLFGQQKVGAEAAAQGQITAVQAAGSLKTIAMRAYEAAAGAYSAIASIPYVGPVLAPIAAGVALAGVFAFAKNIMSAEGGFDIPKGMNPLVQTHSNEMILPSRHADTMRALSDLHLQGGLGGGGGGDHYAINALDAKSFDRMLRGRQGDMLVRAGARHLRNRTSR